MLQAVEAETTSASGSTLGRVHHVAVLVRDLEAAVRLFRDALGLPLEAIKEIPADGVRIAFLATGKSKLELVQPTDASTGVARYLEKHGEGFHHVCYEVDRLADTLARLSSAGVELIDAQPRRGASAARGSARAYRRPERPRLRAPQPWPAPFRCPR